MFESDILPIFFDENLIRQKSSNERRSGSKTPSKLFRNLSLNFIQDFNQNLKATGIVSRAAKNKQNISSKEKSPYCQMAKRRLKRTKKKAQAYFLIKM